VQRAAQSVHPRDDDYGIEIPLILKDGHTN
jgi:hypothetical protein